MSDVIKKMIARSSKRINRDAMREAILKYLTNSDIDYTANDTNDSQDNQNDK